MLESLQTYIDPIVVTLPYLGEQDITPHVLAAAVFVGLTLIFWILRVVVLVRLEALSKKTKVEFDDVLISIVRGVHAWVYTVVALFIALQLLSLPSWLDTTVTAIFLFAIVWQIIDAAVTIVDFVARRFIEKDEDGDGVVDPNSATASHMIGLFARVILWALGLLFVLSNLGVEVTSLIAGLGIGGIAVAFALQGILGDLFSSLSIYFDKPFRIGDFVAIGDDSGTVEKIGIKTTRIRTLQGEELVVSNAELTSTRVQNFKKMEERRGVSNFGVLYETPRVQIEKIPDYVKNIFADIKGVRLDRVFFTTFGDSALNFEAVFYVDSRDYAQFLDVQQKFNLALMKKFEEEGIEFAYPTQTLYVKK